MSQTLYGLLGVSATADQSTINEAYRERVKETHPDLSDAPDAREQFQRITTARDVLTNPAERRRYERIGHQHYCEEVLGWNSNFEEEESHPKSKGEEVVEETEQGENLDEGDQTEASTAQEANKEWDWEKVSMDSGQAGLGASTSWSFTRGTSTATDDYDHHSYRIRNRWTAPRKSTNSDLIRKWLTFIGREVIHLLVLMGPFLLWTFFREDLPSMGRLTTPFPGFFELLALVVILTLATALSIPFQKGGGKALEEIPVVILLVVFGWVLLIATLVTGLLSLLIDLQPGIEVGGAFLLITIYGTLKALVALS